MYFQWAQGGFDSWVGSGFSNSALFIHELRLIGPFSPIHILSFVVLHSLWSAIRDVRRGDIKSHERTMKNLYFLALIITGGFTLFPGPEPNSFNTLNLYKNNFYV